MARIKIVTVEQASPLAPPAGATGEVETQAYLDGTKDPLHLLRHTLAAGAALEVNGASNDVLCYVFSGSVRVKACALAQGSSLIVEYGAAAQIVAGDDGAVVLAFTQPARPLDARPGGHVHALPRAAVPTAHDLGTQNEMGGGIHADAACPTCTVWLHENIFHCKNGTVIPIHSHSEDEIIFVTDGQIQLGQRRYGRGTALAIAATTRYGFVASPEGLSFINFRAASPTVTTSHGVSDEAAMWISKLGKPAYVEFAVQP